MARVYVKKALKKLNILREIILKREQEIAVENLMLGNDVLAVIQKVLERV